MAVFVVLFARGSLTYSVSVAQILPSELWRNSWELNEDKQVLQCNRCPTNAELQAAELHLNPFEWSKDQNSVLHDTRLGLISACKPSLRVCQPAPNANLIDSIILD